MAQSSLYRHITDRSDLVRLAVDYALERQKWPDSQPHWRQYLIDYTISLWRLLEQHPGLSQELKLMRPSPEKVITALTKVALDLLSFGFTAADANMAVDLLAHVTLDSMITEQIFNSPGSANPTVREDSVRAWQHQDERLAHDTRRTMEQSMFDNLLARVELILDGLETRLNAPDNSPVSTTASISGITDGHGVEAVTEEIMALTGVQQVRIKLNAAGISTAVISSTHPLSEQEIGEAVAEAGYLLVSDNA